MNDYSRAFGLSFALLVALSATTVAASVASDRDRTNGWGFGLETGAHKLVEGEWDYSTVSPFGGVRLVRGLSRHWTVSAALRYGTTRPGATEPGQEVGLSTTSGAGLYTTMWQPALSLHHRFSPHARITPVLGFGLGLTSWKVVDKSGEADVGWFPDGDPISGFDTEGAPVTLEGSDLTIRVEFGIDFGVTDRLDLQLGASYGIMPGNDLDNVGLSTYWGAEDVDANTARASVHAGLTWWFGSGDRDGDGVPNERDACPDSPEDRDGYNDNDGCPDADNDQDGIPDADDACPDRPEDFDGFQDEDGCPEPDNDGDGVFDGRDKCPNEPEDIDGWDDADGCPDPDNDQDGVPDERDKCPRTPADSKVDADGCAVEVPAVDASSVLVPAATRGEILRGVNFRTGSAELTAGSLAILRELAARLESDPGLRLEISGHTDDTGSAAANRALSRRRAEAVRGALIRMGIDGARLTAVGFGEEDPIADNTTAEGRAANRRVEVLPQ